MWIERNFPSPFIWLLLLAIALIAIVSADRAAGQDGLQPGEAFVTRFSGTTLEGGRTVIDTTGTVGSILDIRQPGTAPLGEHWSDAPQRGAVSAAEVGQVFGIAIDDGNPPNIYLTATSAFGLHRTADNAGWMAGMWGEEGGPGAVYKLNPENDYASELFAEITLDGRANSGPTLGNIAFDPWNSQLFVSDLETGMIHRLARANGEDLGHYDHGIDGRATFIDAATGETASLPLVAFDPDDTAKTSDCAAGDFATHPECWNYADFRRRVWGLAARRDPASGAVRLYYALWSSQGFGNPAHDPVDRNETRNSVWSVRIDEDGGFDASDVRREFFLPDFFVEDADIAGAGPSHPVADLAFPKAAEQTVMLLAERGGVRNLGLDARTPFAHPHEARVLRYELDPNGVWQPVGRYDVGFYDRERLGQPHLRANAAGGVDFGFGYGENRQADEDKPGEFVWMTGDGLCAPEAACLDRESGQRDDRSEVHGLQGSAGDAMEAVAPAEALMAYPAVGVPYPPQGPGTSFMIDADTDAELDRSDATKIGDVEIYQHYPPEALAEAEPAGVGGADWGVPDYAAEEEWWPEPPPGAVAGQGIPGAGAGQGVPVADLAVQKAVPAPCQSGSLCSFAIVVTNTGTLPFTKPITIVDPLANDWTLAGWGPAGSQWDCQQTGTQLSCTHPAPDLLPGEAGAVIVDLQVPDGQVAGQWQNCAILDFGPGGSDADPSNDEGCAKLQFGPSAPTEQPDLAIDKVAGSADCVPGAPCPFTVTIRNAGQVKFDGTFRFVDTMPAGWSFGNTSQGWWCLLTAGGGPLFSCWRDLMLDPGQSRSLSVTLTPPWDASAGQVENCAEIDWSQTEKDINPANDRVCASVPLTVQKHADIRISKTATSSCEPGGSPCKFKIIVRGLGEQAYGGTFMIVDQLPTGWKFAGGAWDWKCVPEGTQTICSRPFSTGGTLLKDGFAKGSALEFYILMQVPPNQTGVVSNCVTIAFISPAPKDGDKANYEACAAVTFSDPAMPEISFAGEPVQGVDLGIVKELKQVSAGGMIEACPPDQPCRFTIRITNHGTQAYIGPLIVKDDMPAGWKLVKWTGPTLCDQKGDAFSCSMAPQTTLAAGKSVEWTIDLQPVAPQSGQMTEVKNCAKIDWSGEPVQKLGATPGDARAENDGPVCATVTVPPAPPKLRITKTPLQDTCYRGKLCLYKIKIENVGGTAHQGPISVVETMIAFPPVQMEGYSIPWTCTLTSKNAYRCDHPATTLEPNATKPLELVLRRIIPEDLDDRINRLENCASIAQAQATVVPKKSCAYVNVKPEWDLAVYKQGPYRCEVEAAGLCRFTIRVSNLGKAVYSGPLSIVHTLAPEARGHKIKLRDHGPHPWNCKDISDGEIRCDHPGVRIEPEETFRWPLRLVVDLLPSIPQELKSLRNCARAAYTGAQFQTDANPDNDQSCISTPLHRGSVHVTGESDPKVVLGILFPFNCVVAWSAIGLKDASFIGCTDYEFEITNEGRSLYDGPMTLRVEIPSGSDLKSARGKKSAPTCPASGWSCSKSGKDPVCRPSKCRLESGQKVSLLADVSLLGKPFPAAQFPPGGLSKTVCGELEWFLPSRASDIEQKGRRQTSRACGTTRILPPPPRATCPKEEGWKPYPEGAALLPGWKLQRFGTGANAIFCMKREEMSDLQVSTAPQGQCAAGKTCQAEISVGNVGEDAFADAVELQGQVSLAVSISAVTPLPAGWTCQILGGGRYSCRRSPSEFASGAEARMGLALNIPPSFADKQISHSVRIAWPPGEGDANPANDLAAFTIPVAALAKPRAYDLAMTKTTTGSCKPGEFCRFRLRVANQGEDAFKGTISIVDRFSRQGVTLRGAAGGLSCQSSSRTTLSCMAPNQVLEPGGQAIFLIDTTLPRVTQSATLRNCAEIVSPGGINVAKPGRDDIRTLQSALNSAGYDAGPVDGVMGRRTRGAIAAARTAFGLSAGSRIDEKLVAALLGGADQRDTNRGNDSDCVTVDLPAPKVAPAPPKQPPPSKPARPKKEPSKPVLCRGGKVPAGNRCVCPRGTTEVRGRCVRPPTIQVIPPAPPKTVGCTGGKVPVGNRCVCPSGTTEVRGKCLRLRVIPPTIQKAVPPKRCTGGQVLRKGRCVCPPDKPNFINGKCLPLFQVIPPTPPKFQMIPLCPQGQKWVPQLNRCVTILQ